MSRPRPSRRWARRNRPGWASLPAARWLRLDSIALASLDRRRPWIKYLYAGISAPLAAVMGLLYLAGQWTG